MHTISAMRRQHHQNLFVRMYEEISIRKYKSEKPYNILRSLLKKILTLVHTLPYRPESLEHYQKRIFYNYSKIEVENAEVTDSNSETEYKISRMKNL